MGGPQEFEKRALKLDQRILSRSNWEMSDEEIALRKLVDLTPSGPLPWTAKEKDGPKASLDVAPIQESDSLRYDSCQFQEYLENGWEDPLNMVGNLERRETLEEYLKRAAQIARPYQPSASNELQEGRSSVERVAHVGAHFKQPKSPPRQLARGLEPKKGAGPSLGKSQESERRQREERASSSEVQRPLAKEVETNLNQQELFEGQGKIPERQRDTNPVIPEEELFEFVKRFLISIADKKSVGPRVVDAARKAGFVLKKGALPDMLKKHSETFRYNPANQSVHLFRERDKQGQASTILEVQKERRTGTAVQPKNRSPREAGRSAFGQGASQFSERSPRKDGVQLEKAAKERDVRSRSSEKGGKFAESDKDRSQRGNAGSGKTAFGGNERAGLRSPQDGEGAGPSWKRLHESVSPRERESLRHEDRGRRKWEGDWQERNERRRPQEPNDRSRQQSRERARDTSREKHRETLRSPREKYDGKDRRADAGRSKRRDEDRNGDVRRDDRKRRSAERGSQKSDKEREGSRGARSSREQRESDSSAPELQKRTSLAEAIRQQMQRRKEGSVKEKLESRRNESGSGSVKARASEATVGKKTVEDSKAPKKEEKSTSVPEKVESPKYMNLLNVEGQEGVAKSSGVAFTLFGHTVAATNPGLSSPEPSSGLSLNLLEQLEAAQGPEDPSNTLPGQSVPCSFEHFPAICDPSPPQLTDFLQLANHTANPRFQQELQLLDIEAPGQPQKLFGQLLSPVGLPGAFQGVSNRAASAQGIQSSRKETATQTRTEEFPSPSLERQLDALEVHPLYRLIYTDMPRYDAERADWAADFSLCAGGVNKGGSLSGGVNKGASLSFGVITESGLDEKLKRESYAVKPPFWSSSGYTEIREGAEVAALREKLEVGILQNQALLASLQGGETAQARPYTELREEANHAAFVAHQKVETAGGGRIAAERWAASAAAGTPMENQTFQSDLHTLAVELNQSSQDLPSSKRALRREKLTSSRGGQVKPQSEEARRSVLVIPIERSVPAKRAVDGLSDEVCGKLDRIVKKPRLDADRRLSQEGSRPEPSISTASRGVPSGEARSAHERAGNGTDKEQRGIKESGSAPTSSAKFRSDREREIPAVKVLSEDRTGPHFSAEKSQETRVKLVDKGQERRGQELPKPGRGGEKLSGKQDPPARQVNSTQNGDEGRAPHEGANEQLVDAASNGERRAAEPDQAGFGGGLGADEGRLRESRAGKLNGAESVEPAGRQDEGLEDGQGRKDKTVGCKDGDALEEFGVSFDNDDLPLVILRTERKWKREGGCPDEPAEKETTEAYGKEASNGQAAKVCRRATDEESQAELKEARKAETKNRTSKAGSIEASKAQLTGLQKEGERRDYEPEGTAETSRAEISKPLRSQLEEEESRGNRTFLGAQKLHAQTAGRLSEETAPSNLNGVDSCEQLAEHEPSSSLETRSRDVATREEVKTREDGRDKRKCALCGAGPSLMRGEWYCGTCGRKDDACECVKPLRANGGRPPKFSERYSGPKAVVHRVCAFWTPSVYQPGEAFMRLNKAVKDATGSPFHGKARAPVRCTLCNQTGATSRCRVETCNSVYHFACAISAGCRMHACLIESSLSIACPDHFHVSHPVKRGQTAPARELPWNAAKQGGQKRLKNSPLGRKAVKRRPGRKPLPARKSTIKTGADGSSARNLERSHLQQGGEKKTLRTPPILDDTLAGVPIEGFSTPRGSRELKSLFADVRIEREDRLLVDAQRESVRYEREVGKMQRKRVEYMESVSEDASLMKLFESLAPAAFRLLERFQDGEEELANELVSEEVDPTEIDSEGALIESGDKREMERSLAKPPSLSESDGVKASAAERKEESANASNAHFKGPYVVQQLKGGARVLKVVDTLGKGEGHETRIMARDAVSPLSNLKQRLAATFGSKRKTTDSENAVMEGRKRIKPEEGPESARVLELEKLGPQVEAVLRREASAERRTDIDLPEPSGVTSSDGASDLAESKGKAVLGTEKTVHQAGRDFIVESKKTVESEGKDVEMKGKVGSSEDRDRNQSAPKVFGIVFECNACGSKGGFDIMREHPSLPALVCEECLATHDSANFSDRCKQGIERHCQLCGQREKERPQCESCCKAACKPCLIRILGPKRAREIAAVDVWECFSCDPSQLKGLLPQLQKYRRVKKGELTEEDKNEGLHSGLKQDFGAESEREKAELAINEGFPNGRFRNGLSMEGNRGVEVSPQKAPIREAVPDLPMKKPAVKLKSAVKGAGLRRGLDEKQQIGQAGNNVANGPGSKESNEEERDMSVQRSVAVKQDNGFHESAKIQEGAGGSGSADTEKDEAALKNAGAKRDRGLSEIAGIEKDAASKRIVKDTDCSKSAEIDAGEFCCTACGSPQALSRRREHPQLPVMVCDTCVAVYTSADFQQKDNKGWDRSCCLCGRMVEANGRLGCDVCSHVACSDCVWRVLGVDRANQDLMVWLCFSCDTGQLEEFANTCKASRIGKKDVAKSEAALDEHFARLFCSEEEAQQKEAAESSEEVAEKEQPVGHPPTPGEASLGVWLSEPSKQPVDELSERWGFCQCKVCAERFTGGKRDALSPLSRLSPSGRSRPRKNGTRPWAAYSRVGARLMHPDLSQGKERVPIPFTNDVDDDTSPLEMDYITSLRLHPDLLDFHERFEPASGCSGCCQQDDWNSQKGASPLQGCLRTVDDPSEPLNKHVKDLELFEGDAIRTRNDDRRFDWQQEQMRGRLFYDENGLLQLSPDSHPTIIECNARCPCWPDCPNAVLQRGPSVHLEIFKTDNGRGFGVRTREDIQRGRLIGQYVGEVITSEEANKRDSVYLFNMDHHVRGGEHQDEIYVVDGGPASNVIRYINHSCDPNLAIYSVYTDTLHPGKPVLALFAITDIVAGTELAYDYKYGESLQSTPGSNNEGKIQCRCGAAKCQMWLPDPTAAKSEYQD